MIDMTLILTSIAIFLFGGAAGALLVGVVLFSMDWQSETGRNVAEYCSDIAFFCFWCLLFADFVVLAIWSSLWMLSIG